MTAQKHIVLYDGHCDFCGRCLRWLKRLDWLGLFQTMPAHDPRVGQLEPRLAPEALAQAVHCVTAEGKVLRGAEACRFVLARLVPLAPLGWLLWIPGALVPANILYRQISRRRHQLGCRVQSRVPTS